jgi:hypothetical protein
MSMWGTAGWDWKNHQQHEGGAGPVCVPHRRRKWHRYVTLHFLTLMSLLLIHAKAQSWNIFVPGLCRKSSGSGSGWQGSAGNRPGFANRTRRRDSTFGGGGARKDILQTKPLSFRNLHTM